jgi:hypothetical protein
MIRYDMVYGYASKIHPERMFRTEDEVEEYDKNSAIDVLLLASPERLAGSVEDVNGVVANAIVHLAEVIKSLRNEEVAAKWRAEQDAATPAPADVNSEGFSVEG